MILTKLHQALSPFTSGREIRRLFRRSPMGEIWGRRDWDVDFDTDDETPIPSRELDCCQLYLHIL